MFGVLGPVGKLIVANKILEKKDPPQNTNINIQNNYINTSANSTFQRNQSERPEDKGLVDKMKGKASQVIGQSSGVVETKEAVAQLQTAAKVTQAAGAASMTAGAVSFCLGYSWAGTEFGVGAILCYAGIEGYTILENLNHILDNVMDYKERGKWKVDEIARQLKKNTYFSDWVVDKFIIPMKFSN